MAILVKISSGFSLADRKMSFNAYRRKKFDGFLSFPNVALMLKWSSERGKFHVLYGALSKI